MDTIEKNLPYYDSALRSLFYYSIFMYLQREDHLSIKDKNGWSQTWEFPLYSETSLIQTQLKRNNTNHFDIPRHYNTNIATVRVKIMNIF